ncbi:hypothetical protein [Thermomonospora amylolytica]|uniref:hypothetical protein n=1 Tax=Thermomonospora amylolytica TaxID=1411117 RepID=UPI000E6BB856|nr:hypothetical protein [Thermomonospora amylolytica]
MNDALFDVPGPAPAEPGPKLSADQRRARRQAAAMNRGSHPLSVTLNSPLALHPDAAPGDDRKASGLRCGTCRWRVSLGHHSRAYPKCTFGDGARISHGAGTDVRAWWPACRDYTPAEVTG